jgi:hypothetical protein
MLGMSLAAWKHWRSKPLYARLIYVFFCILNVRLACKDFAARQLPKRLVCVDRKTSLESIARTEVCPAHRYDRKISDALRLMITMLG